MSIELNMYQGHMMTAKDDAVVYEPMLGGNGILYGCELTHLGANQVHINEGDGVIKGRKFTVLEETLNVILPETDGLAGRIYIRMDLSDTNEPIKILSVCASSILPDLEQDEDCNHDNGVYEIELATYTGNRSTITDLKSTYLNVSSRMAMFEAKMNGEIDILKKSVADGKALVASALTKAGAETANDATFQVLADNVANARPKQTVWTTSGVNMKDYFPSTWQKLRTGDFIVGTNSITTWCHVGHESKSTGAYLPTKSFGASCGVNYNNTTGILTFNGFDRTFSGDGDWWGENPSWSWNGGNNHGTARTSSTNLFCAWKGTYSG